MSLIFMIFSETNCKSELMQDFWEKAALSSLFGNYQFSLGKLWLDMQKIWYFATLAALSGLFGNCQRTFAPFVWDGTSGAVVWFGKLPQFRRDSNTLWTRRPLCVRETDPPSPLPTPTKRVSAQSHFLGAIQKIFSPSSSSHTYKAHFWADLIFWSTSYPQKITSHTYQGAEFLQIPLFGSTTQKIFSQPAPSPLPTILCTLTKPSSEQGLS